MVRGRFETLRLTDLLAAVRLFRGPVPAATAAPDAGPEVRMAVPDLLGRRQATPQVGRPVPLLLPGSQPSVARQVDATTCGAAVLVLLRLAGDPAEALTLARHPGGAAHRFAALQRETHSRARRWWPRSLGTPPWGAAREARYGPVRYTHRVIGRHRASGRDDVLRAALAAASAGIPVPLYTGGDLGRGATTAVPRHVVLLTAVRESEAGSTATLYEPSSGALHAVPAEALVASPVGPGADPRTTTARLRALGGWQHVVWALLPSGQS